jgi:hypothetical protein
MKTLRRSLAALELLLVLPAALFMTSLFVRSIQPQQFEPAHTAQLIVEWFAARPHIGLWILLIALPLAVLTIGAATLLRAWRNDATLREASRQILSLIRVHASTLLIACATVTASGILLVVGLHLLAD